MVDSREEANSDDWGDPYRPGKVIESNALGISIPILFLTTLAQAEFWRNHCFVARGVEDRNGVRVIRLDFEPALSIRSADWRGSALIDSATSILVRLDFRLAGLTDSSRPRRLEGYTTFVSPSPYFVVPTPPSQAGGGAAPTEGTGECRMSFSLFTSRPSSIERLVRSSPIGIGIPRLDAFLDHDQIALRVIRNREHFMTKPARVGIIGAGGVGGYYGGLLARAGHPVSVFARGANLNALRERGVVVRTAEEEWTSAVVAGDDARS